MFLKLSRDEEIAAFVGDLLSDESAEFKRRLISALSRLDATGWDALEKLVDDMLRQKETATAPLAPSPEPQQRPSGDRGPWGGPPPWERPAATPDQHAIWEAEARAEAEELYQQILEQKKAEAGYSAFPPTGCGDPGGVA